MIRYNTEMIETQLFIAEQVFQFSLLIHSQVLGKYLLSINLTNQRKKNKSYED